MTATPRKVLTSPNAQVFYKIQVGHGKSSYTTKWEFDSQLTAWRWYDSLNTHSGAKKRLIGPEGEVLDRQITYRGQ